MPWFLRSLDPPASGDPPDVLDPSAPHPDDFLVQVDRRIRIAYNELDPITYPGLSRASRRLSPCTPGHTGSINTR